MLELDMGLIEWAARWSLSHLNHICFAIVTTLAAIYGQDINDWIRRRIGQRHLLIRTAAFVFICAFGYGWCILRLTPQLAWGLRQLPTRSLPLALILIFVLLGIAAERRRKI